MVSVIIVSYNEARYLKEAVDSCLNQSYKDTEIIIGDDGSTDESQDIIKAYVEAYPSKISSFIMERNVDLGGVIPSLRVSNVIKRGLSVAQGEYIIVLSGDDFFHDKFSFEKQVGFLDNNTKYTACVTAFRKVCDSGKEVICRLRRLNTVLYWSGDYIHISCFMFRREVYDQGRLLKRFCDDTGLAYSIAQSGKWVYINDVAFSYRQREKSIMHKSDELELMLCELLLFQDVCMKKGYSLSSLSRFSRPLNYVFDNKERLGEEQYKKYLQEGKQFKFDHIALILEFSNASCRWQLLIKVCIRFTKLLGFLFRIFRKCMGYV